MILLINQKESATLTLNLSIMRKSYRNVFKGRYKARRDEFYKSYDYILDSVKKALESQNEVNELHFNKLDLDLLCEILRSYTIKLDEIGLKDEMDVEMLQIMKDLHLRCKELMVA
ncbi:hypothetical protein ACIQ57_24590 [Lysinibacillus xylanilyticus]|uniref:hypothetical protein n=1 Tax=Lysinibacillus xylanilyticus TaxID=582475 RepID=UPI00380A6AE9